MRLNFKCSYMTFSSLTLYSMFFCEIFCFNQFIPIMHIMRKKDHIEIFCSEICWNDLW